MSRSKTIIVQAAGQQPREVEILPNSSIDYVRDKADLSQKENLAVKSASGAGYISDHERIYDKVRDGEAVYATPSIDLGSQQLRTMKPKGGSHLWRTRGWTKEILKGAIKWHGYFKGKNRRYKGEIQCLSGKIKKQYEFHSYIKNPPQSIKRNHKPECIVRKGNLWQLHWPEATDVDQVLISTERELSSKPMKRKPFFPFIW